MNDQVADRVRARLSEAAALPLPGQGATLHRWRALTAWCRDDIAVGRLLEAHADATAILAELGAPAPREGEWWGVWAAEPPQPVVTGVRTDDGWTLTGTKPWCSGAGWCTHALMTIRDAEAPDERHLVAVPLDQPGVAFDSQWQNVGMSDTRTWSATFDGVPAQTVGPGSVYLDRAGFWHGGIGVAACWLGGAYAVGERLLAANRPDPLTRASTGRVDIALIGATWALAAAAQEVDAAPDDLDAARVRAFRVRALVEQAAATTVTEVGRALGAGPLCLDADHAARVADLSVYIRQSHGDRDLATLAGLILGEE